MTVEKASVVVVVTYTVEMVVLVAVAGIVRRTVDGATG